MEIRVLYHLARTGGTIISKCLASMKGVMLLSEVNPQGIVGLSEEYSRSAFYEEAYEEVIRQTIESADNLGCQLVIRDWSHINFMGYKNTLPTYRLEQSRFLASYGFDRIEAFTVRHPMASWESYSKIYPGAGFHHYMKGQYKFAEYAWNNGFTKYEDFLNNPDKALNRLCSSLKLDYDPQWDQKLLDPVVGLTGDPRAQKSCSVDPYNFKSYPDVCNPYYLSAVRLLGY